MLYQQCMKHPAEENLARNHLPWITNDVIERLYITRQTISFLLSPS